MVALVDVLRCKNRRWSAPRAKADLLARRYRERAYEAWLGQPQPRRQPDFSLWVRGDHGERAKRRKGE